MVNLGVPEAEQNKYVRRLAKFWFKKLSWKQKFDEGACPIFTKTVIDKNYLCDREEDLVIDPLPPVTLCEVNKNYPGCIPEGETDINPNCEENPKLCAPPTFCDLPGNRFVSPCDEEVNCYKTPEHPKC